MIGYNYSSEMIKGLGNRVYALHIHDNDLKHDNHQMPYTNMIHFGKFLDALKEIEYKGDITFEVLTCYNRGEDDTKCLPLELIPSFLKLELDIGKYFANYLNK